MAVNLMKDARINEGFDYRFWYRHSDSYALALANRLETNEKQRPLRVANLEALHSFLARVSFTPFRIVLKALSAALRPIIALWNVFFFWGLLRREKFDLLHVNNGGFPGALSCTAIALAAKIVGVPCIVYVVNNVAAPYRTPARWLDYPFDRMLKGAVSEFVTGSRYAADALARVLDLEPSKVMNIYSGVADPVDGGSRALTLKSLGLEDDGRILIMVPAVLEARKGHRYLLDAIAQLLRHPSCGAPFIVVLLGDGPERSSLEEKARSLGLEAAIVFAGYRNNVRELLSGCDFVILPSISHEDFPISILETMSASKAVVASRVSGIPEQVEDHVTGLLVEPGDVRGLSSAISELCGNQEMRETYGKNGRKRFLEHFTAERSIVAYASLYGNLLSD
jgi:glycosyltransferase involved in cell wall biosynthesis